jgi:hypothetical protein
MTNKLIELPLAAPAAGGRQQEIHESRSPVGDGQDAFVRVLQRVAELPDRTSPDDWPEAMLVTGEELRAILLDELPRASSGASAPRCQKVCEVNAAYGPACGKPCQFAEGHTGRCECGCYNWASAPPDANDASRHYAERLHREKIERLLTEVRDLLVWRFRDDPPPSINAVDPSATDPGTPTTRDASSSSSSEIPNVGGALTHWIERCYRAEAEIQQLKKDREPR